MPKKRFTSQYSKPPSTVHPSLSSGGAPSSSKRKTTPPPRLPRVNNSTDNDAPPSVNELIASIRKSNISGSSAAPSTVVTRTLPPQIRQLLSQPETPAPRARGQPRFDANGNRLPAGPAPPRSWLQSSRFAPPLRARDEQERLFPHSIHHLPGLQDESGGRRLQDMCLRAMAREWEFTREYEQYNLADLPVGLRSLLLSNIAICGPEDGVGGLGLDHLLRLPEAEEGYDRRNNNDDFFRLDLSGSVGRSVSFKQLIELLEKPATPPSIEDMELSWEDAISRSIAAPLPHLPHLTHLSISHPPRSISWPRLLTLAKHLPTLTHLSLAYWPVPSLTPNANTAVISSRMGDVQYGGSNYYSHSVDNDFRAAALVLKSLANRLYSLEYLDLEGCADWLKALRWPGNDAGIDWSSQWSRLQVIKACCGYTLHEESEQWEVERFSSDLFEMYGLQRYLAKAVGKGRWVEVVSDDPRQYEGLWKGNGDAEKLKRRRLERVKTPVESVEGVASEDATDQQILDVEGWSVWEQ